MKYADDDFVELDQELDQEKIKNLLLTSDFDDEARNNELKAFLFGRSCYKNDSESIFEQILRTRGSEKSIELIWTKFDLCTRDELLTIVSA